MNGELSGAHRTPFAGQSTRVSAESVGIAGRFHAPGRPQAPRHSRRGPGRAGPAPGSATRATRSPSGDLRAPQRWAAGQEGRVRPCPAGVHWRLLPASAVQPAAKPAGAPRARARPEWVGGAALAMLRAPRTLAPATAQPTKSLPTLNPTELWPSGLSSPQLCPATTATTYYTSLYTQTVPSSAALGTCLDATPHGPEGQIVRCVPAGRLPVIMGTPRTSRIRVWVGKKERGCLGRSTA